MDAAQRARILDLCVFFNVGDFGNLSLDSDKFNAAVDYFEPLKTSSRTLRFGDKVLYWFAQAHFGRFAGVPVKIVWTGIGLTPAALFLRAR